MRQCLKNIYVLTFHGEHFQLPILRIVSLELILLVCFFCIFIANGQLI